MTLLNSSKERRRFLRFSAVGAIGAVVDFAVFNLFTLLIGLAPALSQALSFLAAVTSNFVLNRYWTYPDSRSKRVGSQMLQYGLVNLIGLLIRTPVFVWASGLFLRWVPGLPPLPLAPETLAHNLGLATAIGVVLFWNFFVNRYWTYGDVE